MSHLSNFVRKGHRSREGETDELKDLSGGGESSVISQWLKLNDVWLIKDSWNCDLRFWGFVEEEESRTLFYKVYIMYVKVKGINFKRS